MNESPAAIDFVTQCHRHLCDLGPVMFDSMRCLVAQAEHKRLISPVYDAEGRVVGCESEVFPADDVEVADGSSTLVSNSDVRTLYLWTKAYLALVDKDPSTLIVMTRGQRVRHFDHDELVKKLTALTAAIDDLRHLPGA